MALSPNPDQDTPHLWICCCAGAVHAMLCSPKDSPTLQRFTASLAQLSVGQAVGLSTTAQRHEAGIRAKQQAQLIAAACEVAALDAGSQHDND